MPSATFLIVPWSNIGQIALTPFLVGGHDLFKPALRLMKEYRLKIEENTDTEAVTTSLDGWKRCRSGENTRTST